MVGRERFELSTSRLSSARSNQLSYQPETAATRTGAALPRYRMRQPEFRPIKCDERKRNEGGGFPLCFADHPVRTGACDIPRCFDRTVGRALLREGDRRPEETILRKEVIQPQVPLRLPCYDFTPVADPTVACCPLAVDAQSSGRTNSHGVTGGVYKDRERIHRGMLIHDY